MPEGDSLHRIARELEALVGESISVELPHPRARSLGLERLQGRKLESVQAFGKQLLLRFEGGLVLRSHLGMSGRWRRLDAAATPTGRPWLVLRGERHVAAQWNGPTLELSRGEPALELGPDILAEPLLLEEMLASLRSTAQERALGEVLIDQRLLAGVGNIWRAEGLWRARLSPWRQLAKTEDDDLRRLLAETTGAMRESLNGHRARYAVYRRRGRPCPRCGTPIESCAQADAARTAYWCPGCQAD